MAILLLLTSSAQADGPHRAGLVVSFGGEQVQTACVSFNEESITGIELLRRAGFSLVTGYAGMGVCKINALGCPADNCFCQSFAPPYAYWAYFHSSGDGNWSYSNVGAGGYRVTAGRVEGWSWGSGESAPPPRLSFDQVCPAPTVAPSATPIPPPIATVTPPPTQTPTRLPPTSTARPPTSTPEPPTPTLLPTDSPASLTSTPPPTQTPANTATSTPHTPVPHQFTPTRRPATATLPPTIQPSPGSTFTTGSPTAPPTPSSTPTATFSPVPSQTPTPTATLITETVTPSLPPAAPNTAPPAPTAGQPWPYGVFIVIVVGLVGLLFSRSRHTREES